jgi:uncharacterized SAM-binding protein YcdF (DUF218 family)
MENVMQQTDRRGGVLRRLGAVLRTLWFAAIAATLAFALGFAAFAVHVGAMRTPGDPAPADAIIVLTGGQARLDAAVDLLRSGKGQRLLISGVHPTARPADLRSATGAEASLFDCCVDIDHAALDTIGNAEESAKWIEANAYATVLLVTNNYHMPRSLLEMGRHLDEGVLQPYPVVNSRLDRGEWMVKPDALRVLIPEYLKYLAALARSVLPAPSPSPDAPVPQTTASMRAPGG